MDWIDAEFHYYRDSFESRRVLDRQRDALIKALSRYGYTLSTLGLSLSAERWQLIDTTFYAESKPYLVYEVFDPPRILEIVHACCSQCRSGYAHHREFLKELAQVIGKLDAHAEYDAGEDLVRGPRLRISL